MQAIEIRRERIVAVPADVLWRVVEPAPTLPSWLPICDRCEVMSGEGRGRRQRMYVRWGGRAAEIDQEVIAYIPDSRLSWKHVDERLNGKPAPRISKEVTVTVELQPVGAGTKVRLISRHVPSGFFGALMLRLVGGPRIRKGFDRALDKLSGM
jgi:uncharacterized protein YndB with AHSA1/START domain